MLVATSAAILAAVYRSSNTTPSMLLITLDTFRADRMSAYGGPATLTPNLNRLAAAGRVFTDVSTAAPVTLPSHATILSGLFPVHHGVHLNGTDFLPSDVTTLPERFHAAGFATAAFVGSFVLDHRFGLRRGFDVYDDEMPPVRPGNDEIFSERRCGEVAARATRWLDANTRPFFVWAHFYDAHTPYAPPAPFDVRQGGRPYDGEVAYVDTCVGDLVAAARKSVSGHLTIAVVGDHGEGLGEHGELTHGLFVYQSTMRVPFFLSGAGVAEGAVDARPVRTVDVAPTLLGLRRLPPLPADGVNLLAADPGAAYMETEEPGLFGWAKPRALRDGRWKLIQLPRAELYDLREDPGEAHDRSADSSPTVARFAQALELITLRPRTERGSVDPETAERLAALGYVTATAEPSSAKASGPLRDPKDAVATWNVFEGANIHVDAERVIRGLREAVAAEPENVTLLRSIALTYRRLERTEEEEPIRERLIELDPADCSEWHELSVVRARKGALDEARRASEKAVACDPKKPTFRNQLAAVDTMLGRHEEALLHLDAAIALDASNTMYPLNRAHTLWSLGRRSDALDAFRSVLAHQPRNRAVLVAIGGLEAEMGLLEDAEAHLRSALALQPDPQTMCDLAEVLARRGDASQARAVAEAALSASPPAAVGDRLRKLLGGLR